MGKVSKQCSAATFDDLSAESQCQENNDSLLESRKSDSFAFLDPYEPDCQMFHDIGPQELVLLPLETVFKV